MTEKTVNKGSPSLDVRARVKPLTSMTHLSAVPPPNNQSAVRSSMLNQQKLAVLTAGRNSIVQQTGSK